jgi:uncharacterized Fe-S cluster-containing radical SAM superfamily enzyme
MYEMNSGYVIWISNEHIDIYATSVRLGLVRANQLILKIQGSSIENYDSNLSQSIATECFKTALKWRGEGYWDSSTTKPLLGLHQSFGAIVAGPNVIRRVNSKRVRGIKSNEANTQHLVDSC